MQFAKSSQEWIRITYDLSGLIAKGEAEQALAFAQTFSDNLRTIITGQMRLGI